MLASQEKLEARGQVFRDPPVSFPYPHSHSKHIHPNIPNTHLKINTTVIGKRANQNRPKRMAAHPWASGHTQNVELRLVIAHHP